MTRAKKLSESLMQFVNTEQVDNLEAICMRVATHAGVPGLSPKDVRDAALALYKNTAVNLNRMSDAANALYKIWSNPNIEDLRKFMQTEYQLTIVQVEVLLPTPPKDDEQSTDNKINDVKVN